MITRPQVFEGDGRPFVNADVGTNGGVRASVVAGDGSPIDGVREEDCRAVCGDSTRQRVNWGSKERLASLKDRYIRLAFHLKHPRLYFFWIE